MALIVSLRFAAIASGARRRSPDLVAESTEGLPASLKWFTGSGKPGARFRAQPIALLLAFRNVTIKPAVAKVVPDQIAGAIQRPIVRRGIP